MAHLTRVASPATLIGQLLGIALALSLLPAAYAQSPAAVSSVDQKAFGHGLPGMTKQEFVRMFEGKRVFARTWSPPASAGGEHLGLGPHYDAPSCTSCHFNDGRGAPDAALAPMIYRLRATAASAKTPASLWGAQLQQHAVDGRPEGRVSVTYERRVQRYPDDTPRILHVPRYSLAAHGTWDARILSPRIPPTLVGVGLLEALPAAAIRAGADPDDANQDGISGRVRELKDRQIGRFGWKAQQPDLQTQVTAALAEDMGIIAPARASAASATEITAHDLHQMLAYLRLLAPPAARRDHPLFEQGQQLFAAAGCDGCHRPRWTTSTAPAAPSSSVPASVYDRQIEPYTDLLLHDLGPGLADGGGEHMEDREWRTAPLWGLGLLPAVNGQMRLLHDGRARSFDEAILWHDGEARNARERFEQLSRAEREALVAFLASI